MEETVDESCPHCGEPISVSIDADEGSSRRIVDCDVCCRPIEVRCRVRSGLVVAVSIEAV